MTHSHEPIGLARILKLYGFLEEFIVFYVFLLVDFLSMKKYPDFILQLLCKLAYYNIYLDKNTIILLTNIMQYENITELKQ